MSQVRNLSTCCGIQEVHTLRGFHADLESQRIIQSLTRPDENGRVIAVTAVATDAQLTRDDLRDTLSSLGFKLVLRWNNRNSGNYCNLFVVSGVEAEEFDRMPAYLRDFVKVTGAPENVVDVPENPKHWVLYRIRFDRSGVVDRRIAINNWLEKPAEEIVQQSIQDYKDRFQQNTSRWRFELIEEEVADED